MSEYTTLTSYLEALVAERDALNTVDIDAIVEERISSIRAKIRADVVADVEHTKLVTDVKISTLTEAISIVTRTQEVEENEDEVPEVISDDTI